MPVPLLAVFESLDGPQFLIAFALWGLVLRLALGLVRYLGSGFRISGFVGIVILLIPAIIRYVEGSRVGIHKWGGLILLSIIWVVFFFGSFESPKGIDRRNTSASYSSTNLSGSSCASSGGGGCGGGAGCGGGGGCGGCGGS